MGGLFAGTPLERPVTCERCERVLAECACPRDSQGRVLLPKDQPARVSRERRGGGKMVTLVTGLDASATDLPALLRELRAACAAGGTSSDGTLELQGDHRERVLEILKKKGYPAKISGG
jgi:translation initiation factor 1